MVAECYLNNPEGYNEVNHLNNNRLDNRIENLEWCSSKMNVIHNVNNKRHAKGSMIGSAKLTETLVKEIRILYCKNKISISKLAKKYGVSQSTMASIIKRKTWKHVE